MTRPGRPDGRVVAAVAAGGALGAAARYGIALGWPTPPGEFPWATLLTNLVGCALLGALMRLLTAGIVRHRMIRPFLGTGVLGGFTTFSAYALESHALLAAGRPGLAGAYLLGTVAGALLAFRLGALAARPLWGTR